MAGTRSAIGGDLPCSVGQMLLAYEHRGASVSDRQTFRVTVGDDPAAVERVISACRSRCCEIASLRYKAGDDGRPGTLHLELTGTERMRRLAIDRVARLVGVLAVVPGRSPHGGGR